MVKLLSQNKKARHDYFFLETFECGLVLTGTEIKSLRRGGLSLRDSFAKVDANMEVWLLGANIAPYEQGNRFNSDPLRPKKLLLNKKEIRKLLEYTAEDGLTLVPVQAYLNEKGKAKLELAVAKGKKIYDKRDDIARRDAARDMDRRMKEQRC